MKGTFLFAAASLVVFTSVVYAAKSTHQEKILSQEKCYGIVKAGLNDCDTNTTTCAGSSTKDNQPDAYILLPKGTCERIVGGSLTNLTKKDNDKKGN